MGGVWPYNCCFVACSFPDLFKTAHSIFMLFPSSFFTIRYMSQIYSNKNDEKDSPRFVNNVKIDFIFCFRPLIPLKQQMEYDSLCPVLPSDNLKVIRLRRYGNESLGFAVRGGKNNSSYLFVTPHWTSLLFTIFLH